MTDASDRHAPDAPCGDGQAPALSDAAPIGAANGPKGPAIWAIGGGKGGVGKSMIATNLAVGLTESGYKVTLVDGDLGGANLDTFLGCERPDLTLGAFFRRQVRHLGETAVETGIDGLTLIAGDAETLGAANPVHAQKLKLIRHLKQLSSNIVVLDLGAGTTFNTLDLFLAADLGMVVTVPEPTAIQNCFAFLKAVTLRDIERRTGTRRRDPVPGNLRGSLDPSSADAATERAALSRSTPLIVNRARPSDGRSVVQMLSGLVSRFLGGSVQLAGVVREDPQVRKSVQQMTPLLRLAPGGAAATDIRAIAGHLLGPRQPIAQARRVQMGLNEGLVIDGQEMHLQTEDLGEVQAAIRSQVFFPDGSVAYSRRTPYQDRFFAALSATPQTRSKFHHAAIKKALQSGRIRISGRKSA